MRKLAEELEVAGDIINRQNAEALKRTERILELEEVLGEIKGCLNLNTKGIRNAVTVKDIRDILARNALKGGGKG